MHQEHIFIRFLYCLKVNYALAYKKGVAPPRSQGPKRMSEYAKQFTWKKGLASSPLLAAEQVKHIDHQKILL